jgi:hypothetical protein
VEITKVAAKKGVAFGAVKLIAVNGHAKVNH